jgi:ADP-heptose:LPS heptosyltransferase
MAGMIALRMDNGAVVKSLHGNLRGHGNWVRIHGNRGMMENSRWGNQQLLRIRREPYEKPQGRYCVLHLGASSPHKLWPVERWRELQQWAEGRGYQVVLSAGRGEEALLAPLDPDGRRSSLAGRLDLAQIWDLLRNAEFLVCPDTGIAHLARLVGVPTVALYGPGSPISTGPGRFWAQSPFRAVWDPEVACRDQDRLFERRLVWLHQCWRSVAECGNPICIRRNQVAQVIGAIEELVSV